MSRTTILFGPPGCGKTTALLRTVEQAFADGVSPEKVAFFAFTKKAANEAVTRAGKLFGFEPKQLPWFRTLHSAAYRILGLRSSDVMTTAQYAEVGKALGAFTFKYQYDEATERPPGGGGLGDRALAIYALARARGVSVEQALHESIMVPDISLRDAVHFETAVQEYKRYNGLLDFADFMDLADGELDLDLLIIDEAQDLTHQQWEFARRIGRRVRRVMLAGDDDQCIYQWAGADLRLFLEFAGNVKVLSQSYRLPRRIWRHADQLAQRIRIRKQKTWSPRDEEGEIDYLDYIDQVPLQGTGSWLLLARHQRQLMALVKVCRDQGVVYSHNGWWSNQTNAVRAVVDYERLRHGETLTRTAANRVLYFVRTAPGLGAGLPEVGWDDMKFPFEGRPDWMAALDGLPGEEKEYIRRLRLQKESLAAPGRVVLSTIHGAKGGEADNVMLLPDYNTKVSMAMAKDTDSETRVWYVGTSRAKRRLFWGKPIGRRFFQ